jgi:hypothetical protein
MVVLGAFVIVVGAGIWILSRFGGLSRIPGTLRIEGSGFTCLFPILGSILLSILLTIILNLAARIIK